MPTVTDAEIARMTRLGVPAKVRRDALVALNLNGTYSPRRVRNARERIVRHLMVKP